jgi:acetaldehyde dehydrogenase (acetylating)
MTNSNHRAKVAILGPGNIGTDLMYKILRSRWMELALMSGVIPTSAGLALARQSGIATSVDGVQGVLDCAGVRVVFDATGAKAHRANAPLFAAAGIFAIDLTPAALGPFVVPWVNMDQHFDSMNVNMVTCGGQATIPIAAAISRVCRVRYCEIVATIASKSAGPGTRQNIDEFTQTTARGLELVGGAKKGKAIIILNPAEPPIMMRNTVYALVDHPDESAIRSSVLEMVAKIQGSVPGYRLKVEPFVTGDRVTTMVEVTGAGDYLPVYSGNLDVMTSAACAVGELVAARMLSQ